jgi:hypothetical protein
MARGYCPSVGTEVATRSRSGGVAVDIRWAETVPMAWAAVLAAAIAAVLALVWPWQDG